MNYQVHSACGRVPALSKKAFNALKQHIETHGQQDPIVIWQDQAGQDQIIDGRHRYQACMDLGIKPHFERLQGDENDALIYIFTKLKNYRQMTRAQLALWLAQIQPELSEEKWSAILHSPSVHHSHIKKAQELLKSDAQEDLAIIEQITSGELKSLAPVLRKANPKLLLKNRLIQEFNQRLAMTMTSLTVEQLSEAANFDSPMYHQVLQTVFASEAPQVHAIWQDRYGTIEQALAAIKNETFVGAINLQCGALNKVGHYLPFVKDADLLKNLAPTDLALLWLQARVIQSQRWKILENKPKLNQLQKEAQVFSLGHKEMVKFKKKLLAGIPLTPARLRSFLKLLTSPIQGCRIIIADSAGAKALSNHDIQHSLAL